LICNRRVNKANALRPSSHGSHVPDLDSTSLVMTCACHATVPRALSLGQEPTGLAGSPPPGGVQACTECASGDHRRRSGVHQVRVQAREREREDEVQQAAARGPPPATAQVQVHLRPRVRGGLDLSLSRARAQRSRGNSSLNIRDHRRHRGSQRAWLLSICRIGGYVQTQAAGGSACGCAGAMNSSQCVR